MQSFSHLTLSNLEVRKSTFTVALIFVLSAMAASTFAASSTITSYKATYMYQGNADGCFGGEKYIKFGSNVSSPSNNYMSLVEFDLSSIPSGSTITSAYLKLNIYKKNDLGIIELIFRISI